MRPQRGRLLLLREHALLTMNPVLGSKGSPAIPVEQQDLEFPSPSPLSPLFANMTTTNRRGFCNWSKTVVRGIPRNRWIQVSIATIVVFIILGITLGWELKTTDITLPDGNFNFPGRWIAVGMDLISADPLAGTFTLDWRIDDDTCWPQASGGRRNVTVTATQCPLVNIFFDENLAFRRGSNDQSDDSPVPSNDEPTRPVFKFDASTLSDIKSNVPGFRTQVNLDNDADGLAPSLENYPFDLYSANLYFFGQQEGNNASVLITVDVAVGVVVGFKARLELLSDDQLTQSGITALQVVVSRTPLVKVYVIAIIAAMWSITLAFTVITIRSFFGWDDFDASILVVPVATLFAFTSLRASLPGAPSTFGSIIDFVGTLPTLIYLSFAALGCLIHLAIKPQKARQGNALQENGSTLSA